MRAGRLGATRKPHPHTVRAPSSTPDSAVWPQAGRRGRRIAADEEGDAEIESKNVHDKRKGVAAARGAAATAPKPLLDVDGETVAFAAFRPRAGAEAGTLCRRLSSVLRCDLERPLEAVLTLVDQPRQEGVRQLDRVFVDELDYEDHDRLGLVVLVAYSR
jgi:hypothetical protein